MKTLNPIALQKRYPSCGKKIVRQVPPLRRNRPRLRVFPAFMVLIFCWVVLAIELERGAFSPLMVSIGWKRPAPKPRFRTSLPVLRPIPTPVPDKRLAFTF